MQKVILVNKRIILGRQSPNNLRKKLGIVIYSAKISDIESIHFDLVKIVLYAFVVFETQSF